MTSNLQTPARSTAELRASYRQARARFEADPQNPQHRRALGWVYADLLKETSGQAQPGSTDTSRMLRGLALIADFPMPDEARWRESVAWSVCRFLLRHKPATLPLGPLAEVVSRAGAFIPAEPGLLRSVWWKALLRHAATGIDWLGLVAQHGWEGTFRPEDEQPQPYGDGKTAGPLLEGLIQAVCRQLLQSVVLPDERAAPWLQRLSDLTARHPDWDFLPYYHAKLLLRLDRTDEAMAVFLPFARRKKKEFWVWSMLAELVAPELAPACFARALSLGAPEIFLVKVRQRVAAWLIQEARWADARAEIDRLVATRRASNWPVPADVQRWLNDDRYTQSDAAPLGHWYGALLPRADALLWSDSSEAVVLVTGLDATGQCVYVAIDARTTGRFPAGKFGLNPAVGDRLVLRYSRVEKNGRVQLRVHAATATDAALSHLQIRTVTAPLRPVADKGVGFVGNVYVPADLLAAYTGLPGALVTVAAVEAWDAVKQKSGWRAFRIQTE